VFLAFTDRLKDAGVAISMDGRSCWRDNVLVERLWRGLKYEEVCVRACKTVRQSRKGYFVERIDARGRGSALRGVQPILPSAASRPSRAVRDGLLYGSQSKGRRTA
jgi:putative transposase